MKKGTKVFIKELNQIGIIESLAPDGSIEKVKIQTPEGEKVIEILNKGYKIISLIKAIWELLLNFFKK